MKKLSLFPLLGLIFLFGCGTTSTPVVTETTTTTTVSIVDCKNDMNCLQRNFSACNAATFSMPFSEGTEYTIEVIGQTDGICDYKAFVGNQSGSMGTECKLPIAMMDADRIGHLFGAEKAPGKEAIAQAQVALDAQYCIQF